MAKFLPPQGKFVDVVVKVTDARQLIECADCQEPMIVTSVIEARLVDNPTFYSINHNLICPKCQGMGIISLKGPS